jgi:hypothetical protein
MIIDFHEPIVFSMPALADGTAPGPTTTATSAVTTWVANI